MAEEEEHGLNKSRLEALTDGLFATVMTILVLSLIVPVYTGPNLSQQLTAGIISLIPNILVYIASFIVLGVLWIGHNGIFRYLHRMDRRFQWLNLLLLLGVGAVPFSTALLGKYPLQQPAIIVYGLNFLILAIAYNVLSHKILRHHRMDHKEVDMKAINRIYKNNILSVIVYSLSLVMSFASPYISLALFVLMPIYYIINGLRTPL